MADTVELEVSGLTRRYSPQVTVGPISFEVRAGEFFSLLGPSGCGKTTTLRCIAGFETLDCRRDPAAMASGSTTSRRNRRDVGLVFQNYALFPHLTVFDNVAFGLRLRRVAKPEIAERVAAILRLVDLPRNGASAIRRSFPAASSSASRSPARWCSNRSILMFDEPLSNLDFKLRIQMRDELRALAAPARQDRDLCHARPDRGAGAVRPHRGVVARPYRADRHPGEIYERPATAFVAEFIGSSNLLPARDRRARRGRRRRRDAGRAAAALRRRREAAGGAT